jgi:Cu/Ag efflux protein CusF
MRTTKTLFFVAAGALAGWVTAAHAQEYGNPPSGAEHGGMGAAHEGAPGAAKPGESDTAQKGTPTVMQGQLITATAKVDKVDLDKRELTLKSDTGKPFTINVPENVSRLDNVKAGDKVRLSFYESVAVSLQKPGEAPVGETKKTFEERATGELPGGMVGQQVTTTAKITKIDPAQKELTIEGPGGKANTLQVSKPELRAELKNLKVGDQIKATYTQALATSVSAPHRM